MGKWKFTAEPRDINRNSKGGRVTGTVSGPDPSQAREAVREHVQEQTSAWSVDVYMDDLDD